MRKIVIIGAGLTGLLAAIKLKKLGLDVVIADPRIGDYVRPGSLDGEVFKALSKAVGKDIEPSSSNHIKDAERALYDILKALDIEIKKASFEKFYDGGVQIKFSDGKKEDLSCDLVIDATGSKRVLVNKVIEVEKSFTVEPIVKDAPEKKYLIAYVKVNESDKEALKQYKNKVNPPSDLYRIQKLETLRAMGWPGFVEPECHVQILDKGKEDKNKICFYVSLPPNLAESDYDLWLRNVLALKTGKDDITFQKIPFSPSDKLDKTKNKLDKTKVRFGAFTVYPHKVNESYSIGVNRPVVVPLGDSHDDPVFTIGIGVQSLIDQVDAFCKSIQMGNNSEHFAMDWAAYDTLSKLVLNNHEKTIIKYYKNLNTSDESFIYDQIKRYSNAVLMTTDQQEKSKLQHSYDLICSRLVKIMYKQAIFKFSSALNEKDGSIKRDQYNMVTNEAEKALSESVLLLEHSLTYFPGPAISSHIFKALKEIAVRYTALAAFYFNTKNYGLAYRYYTIAGNLFAQNYFSNANVEEYLQIQYKIVQICCKQGAYLQAFGLLKEIQNSMQGIVLKDREKFLAGIAYSKVFVTYQFFLTSNVRNITEDMLSECKKNYWDLQADHKTVTKKELLVLRQLLDGIVIKAGLNQQQPQQLRQYQ